ncbi:hypothetical protein FP435_00185 (plasmid) [Lactobacillus sp. PV037]|uniref:hypothetical protein n=1 Tax=Lactobacillus sp. PV037 TaxID=2594496 RepID=UPI002240B29C|nr:hypothetical protein [Lactobacillus sp. PV037]QNQ82956.1 hypothetical protein FP435_00185 [Lactobacillus sp. PV037]
MKNAKKNSKHRLGKLQLSLLIIVGVFFVGGFLTFASTAPKYATQQRSLLTTLNNGFNNGKSLLSAPVRGFSAAVGDAVKGKGFHPIKETKQIYHNDRTHDFLGRQDEEMLKYQHEFKQFNKNFKPISLDTGMYNGKSDGIVSLGNDSKLTKAQNQKIDKEFTSSYNKWLKSQKSTPTSTVAKAKAMELMKNAYTKVLGSKNKRVQELTKADAKSDKELKKTQKDLDKGKKDSEDGEPSSFSGKIAHALLYLFYSSGIGSWLSKSGPGSVVFGISYKSGMSGAEMYSQIATNMNATPFSSVYPPNAYTASISTVAQKIGPIFLGLAAVLIVIFFIVLNTRLGVGQVFNPVRAREDWYRGLWDTVLAVMGCLCYGYFISMILYINDAFVVGLANFMAANTTGSKGYSILSEAVTLGFSQDTVNMLTSGTFLGSEFVGIVFSIIYLITYIGLAVYIKYYYLMREIAFTILWALGPLFIAFWPTNWGKNRTISWFREIVGTVFIQSIHALTLTFMAFLMAWNNRNWANAKSDITTSSNFDSAAQTWSSMWGNFTHFNILGGAGNLIKGAGQAAGIVGGNTHVSGVAGHFETMVIGWIIMLLFQPVSKSLADLFGIRANMLENVHQSTSQTLKSAAVLTGGAIAGATALGIGAHVAGGAGLASGVKSLSKGAQAFKAAENGKKGAAFRNAFKNQWNNENDPLNKVRAKVAKKTAQISGFAGRTVGQMAGQRLGNTLGVDGLSTMAATVAGGEIGTRASNLVAGKLSGLGLKKADPNRKKKENLKNNLNKATQKATTQGIKKGVDKSAGLAEQLKKATQNPNLSKDEQLQQVIAQAQKNSSYAAGEGADLDENEAFEARASRLTEGANNYKDANKVFNAYKERVNKSNLSPKQKQAAIQAGAKAMIQAGAPAYDPKVFFDRKGFADAQSASENAKKTYLSNLENLYNNGSLPNTPSVSEVPFSDWRKSTQFKQDYEPQLKQKTLEVAQNALNNSNGHIYGNVDTDKFANGLANSTGVMINSDIFSQEAAKHLQENGLSDAQAASIANVGSSIPGQSLTEKVDIPGTSGGQAQILNAELWKDLNNQSAQTANATWGGLPKVKGSDLDTLTTLGGDNVYGGLVNRNDVSPSVEGIEAEIAQRDAAAYTAEGRKNWADFKNASDQGASFNILNPRNYFTPQGSTQPTKWDLEAQERISNNPDLKPFVRGMDLEGAYKILPKVIDPQGNSGIAIKPGSFRMAIENTHSLLQAQDEDGNWFAVGNVGSGDGTLGAGKVVYQDLDLTPDGMPSIHYDTDAHRISSPYTLDSEGEKIPTTLVNGTPSLGDFFPNSAILNSMKVTPGDFYHLPESPILKKELDYGSYPTVEDYSKYSDFRLQGNNNNAVITAMNPANGAREIISPFAHNNNEFKSLPSDVNYSIPLVNNGETGLDINAAAIPELFYNGNISQNQRNLSKEVMDDFMSNNRRINSLNNYLHDTLLPYTTPDIRNFISNHPGMLSATNLDTFYKGLYEA